MSDGFPNKPRTERGAFVEFGLSVPPLLVVFQFNPVQLTRKHGLTYSFPGAPSATPAGDQTAAVQRTLRERRAEFSDLLELQKEQLVTVQDHSIAFDIRLDATDRLDGRDPVAQRHGIAPQLATLELMMYPKQESLLGQAVDLLLNKPDGFSFTRTANPPLVLFVFGRKRVLPVNINTMAITETEFSADLSPVRASVAVDLTVIEGNSVPFLYSKAVMEQLSVLDLVNNAATVHVALPG